MAKAIHCDVFVIPNSIHTFRREDATENLYGERVAAQFSMCKFGAAIDSGKEFSEEKFVQVWYVTPGKSDSNWFDHNVDLPGLEHYAPITDRLPVSLFEGYKEGDYIMVPMYFRKHHEYRGNDEPSLRIESVMLRMNNLGYRYSSYGPFEKALNELNVCEGVYHKD